MNGISILENTTKYYIIIHKVQTNELIICSFVKYKLHNMVKTIYIC